MKILLIGEYSNLHWSLSEGLREAGHEVCVLSNGDFWKNYRRDISLVRGEGRFAGIRYMFASSDKKADLKKGLGYLTIGSIIVFGAVTIIQAVASVI